MSNKTKISIFAVLLAFLSCACARTATLPVNTSATNTSSGPASGSTTNSKTSSASTPSTAIKSVYTDLGGSGCGPAKTTSEISSETTCGGVEGYKLVIQTDDDRDSITIVTPDGQKHPLDFWEKISKGAFAALGQKAEWRVVNQNGKDVPIALIVRVDVQANEKKTSYLAVSKISEKSICVTDRIDPSADANEKARIAADASGNKPCLK